MIGYAHHGQIVAIVAKHNNACGAKLIGQTLYGRRLVGVRSINVKDSLCGVVNGMRVSKPRRALVALCLWRP